MRRRRVGTGGRQHFLQIRTEAEAGRQRGHEIFGVVRSAKTRFRHGDDRRTVVQNHVPLAQGEIRLDRGRGGESHALRAQGRQFQARVDHGKIFRRLAVEDAQFRSAVGGHIRVAVQMVCAEVGPDRYPWPKSVRCFQLERADLNDGRIERTAVGRHFAEGQADVAAGFGGDAGCI